jgi:5-bromo-4-chloroindolyl phosphate hydrolysis protein
VQMEKIRWIIITSANAQEVFAKLEAEGIDPVLFGLTDKDYEIIAKNFAQIRAKLKESNEILDKYKQYYEADLQPKKEAEKK